VGLIPHDWKVFPLSECAKRITDGEHLTPRRSASGYYLLSARNVLNDRIDLSDVDYVEDGEYRRIRQRCDPETGDVLISCSGTIGRAITVPNGFKCVMVRSVALVKPDPETVIGEFVKYFLQSYMGQKQIFASLNQGAQPNLFLSHIQGLRIPVPPTKGEQEAIAGALSDADTLIEFLEQLIAKKRQIKHGAMQELLRQKDGWAVKKLRELANIQRGASPRPIDSPIWFDENSSIGWVRISDVTQSGMYLRETTQRLSPLGVRQSRPVSSDSLIMSICATVGRPIITEIDTCIHDGFVIFNNLSADKHFLYYVLKSIEDGWSRHGQTGSQMNLNTGLINQTEIALPRRDEQTTIAAILSDMDAEITALEGKLAKARQIKQGMMQELLTGTIRLL
jgi:type I restriction enzyme S subunit